MKQSINDPLPVGSDYVRPSVYPAKYEAEKPVQSMRAFFNRLMSKPFRRSRNRIHSTAKHTARRPQTFASSARPSVLGGFSNETTEDQITELYNAVALRREAASKLFSARRASQLAQDRLLRAEAKNVAANQRLSKAQAAVQLGKNTSEMNVLIAWNAPARSGGPCGRLAPTRGQMT